MSKSNEIIIESSAADLEVSSDNYETFDQELDAAKYGEKLIQENALKGTLKEYQLYASQHLLLNIRNSKKAKPVKFRLNLSYLSTEPQRNKVIVWNWLYGFLAGIALSSLFIFLGVAEVLNQEYSLVGGSIFLTVAIICLLIFIYLMRDEYVFKSHFGGIELFLMDNLKPSQEDFNHFLLLMQHTMEKSQSQTSIADRLLEELKMCRRLKDEGIIDDEAYTAARTRIFRHKQFKA